MNFYIRNFSANSAWQISFLKMDFFKSPIFLTGITENASFSRNKNCQICCFTGKSFKKQ